MNGEFVNQLWLAAPIYHIYYAAQCDTTTSKILDKPEVVLDIQYMLLFLFGANTLNSTRYCIDPVYDAVFDVKRRNPKRFDDEKLEPLVLVSRQFTSYFLSRCVPLCLLILTNATLR